MAPRIPRDSCDLLRAPACLWGCPWSPLDSLFILRDSISLLRNENNSNTILQPTQLLEQGIETKAQLLSAAPQLDPCIIRQGVAACSFSEGSSRDRIWGVRMELKEPVCWGPHRCPVILIGFPWRHCAHTCACRCGTAAIHGTRGAQQWFRMTLAACQNSL